MQRAVNTAPPRVTLLPDCDGRSRVGDGPPNYRHPNPRGPAGIAVGWIARALREVSRGLDIVEAEWIPEEVVAVELMALNNRPVPARCQQAPVAAHGVLVIVSVPLRPFVDAATSAHGAVAPTPCCR
jgi:hypothetical protein